MTKRTLALWVVFLAVGINVFAFWFSKKNFVVEETKNIWIHELPKTPLVEDGYSGGLLGPKEVLIGKLWRQDGSLGLASDVTFDQSRTLRFRISPSAKYENGEMITAEHWLKSLQHFQKRFQSQTLPGVWGWVQSLKPKHEGEWVMFSVPKEFEIEALKKEIFSSVWLGVQHPNNLSTSLPELRANPKLFISSGPYRIRKWRPKEIVLVSRPFVYQLPDTHFRTIKYQSAPILNPSCHYIENHPDIGKIVNEHRASAEDSLLQPYLLCRSDQDSGSVCGNAEKRKALWSVLQGEPANGQLSGVTVRVRIPEGTEAYRAEIRDEIRRKIEGAGGQWKEVSFFFEPSEKADLEMSFASFSESEKSLFPVWIQLTTRLSRDWEARNFGEVPFVFPIRETQHQKVWMKDNFGPVFDTVFINENT